MQELFVIETERVRVAWGGPRVAGAGPLRAEGLRPGATVRVVTGAGERAEGAQVAVARVRLVEEGRYTLLVQSLTGAPVDIRHRDPVVVNGLAAGDGGRVVHGRLTFGSQVGTSLFTIVVGGVAEVAFSVTVAPVKVTPADVATMRRDVEETAAGLGAAYLRTTTTGATRDPGRRPGRPVWAALLRSSLAALDAALAHVALRPREDAARTPAGVRADRLARPDAALVGALRRGGGTGPRERVGDVDVRRTLPAHPFRPHTDTPAHRWLRARIDAARRRVGTLLREEAQGRPGLRRARTRAELAAAASTLDRLAAQAPLAGATPDRPPAAPPLVLRRAPGYTEAYAALQALETALNLGGGPLRATPLDLATLYEVWATLEVVKTAATLLETDPAPALEAAGWGVALTLRGGHAAAARLRGPDGTTLRIARAPRLDAAPALLAQRPDLLLTVARPGRAPRLFVLDAKYRRDDSPLYRRRHGAPGPPEDALGALHRYRDAIVRPGPRGVERPIEQAAALFPYREPAEGSFQSSRLWTGLPEIGVGALPLLPGQTRYLEAWLRTILRG